MMQKIAIVGAGVGGLTAAVALARRGIECLVFERHATLPDEGFGIQISPNAVAELSDLGVSIRTGVRLACRETRRWDDGELIARTELDGYGAPYVTMRRGALVAALRDGAGTVRFGRRCTAVEESRDGVVLRFAGGEVERADAAIGADGLHSAVRKVLTRDPPRDSGYRVYRAVVTARLDRVVVWLGPGGHCVAYPIDAEGHVNVVAVVPYGSDLRAFDGWHPAVRELIGRAGRPEPRVLYDRAPMPRWHRGRVVLIGDAAHPMLPFVAQGAAQAIEDAVTLARCVSQRDAFAVYEATRRERAERIAAFSRRGLRDYHLPDGRDQRERDRALAVAPPLGWLYDHRASAAL